MEIPRRLIFTCAGAGKYRKLRSMIVATKFIKVGRRLVALDCDDEKNDCFEKAADIAFAIFILIASFLICAGLWLV